MTIANRLYGSPGRLADRDAYPRAVAGATESLLKDATIRDNVAKISQV
jgi:hypothetical protein